MPGTFTGPTDIPIGVLATTQVEATYREVVLTPPRKLRGQTAALSELAFEERLTGLF